MREKNSLSDDPVFFSLLYFCLWLLCSKLGGAVFEKVIGLEPVFFLKKKLDNF